VTLGTFFILQGLNLGVTRMLSGTVSSSSISDMDGFQFGPEVFASDFNLGPINVKILVLWWILFVVVASWCCQKTKVGNWSSRSAWGRCGSARAVGVPVKRVKIASS